MSGQKTVLQVQSAIAAALQSIPDYASKLPDALKPLENLVPPKGMRAEVSLRHAATNRQVRRNAPMASWSPESGLVTISYDASAAEDTVQLQTMVPPSAEVAPVTQRLPVEDPVRGLVLALDRAEKDPKRGFVALKWFRDSYLPEQGLAWAATPEARHRAIVEADRRRWVLTSKIPNPKNPEFPVTTIRVNRTLNQVREILEQEATLTPDFAPLPIRGEPLSDTVLRERR